MRRLCASLLAIVLAVEAAAAPVKAMPSQAPIRIDIAAMTEGPDGNVWFADGAGNAIGRVSRTGQVTIFKLPFLANPRGIAPGPGGAVYFSEYQGGKIGRITAAGKISQISLSTTGLITDYLKRGPNNTLWFVDGNNIGELTGSLKFVLHKVPEPTGGLFIPMNLAVTSYGNVWFNDFAPYQIKGVDHHALVRLTPQGKVTAYPVTYGGAGIATGLTVGPDGNLWYILTTRGLVGRATPAGKSTVYLTSPTVGTPEGIVSGPQQSLWLTCTATSTVSRSGTITDQATIEAVTTAGKARQYRLSPLANATSGLGAITVGSDGNLWFPEIGYGAGAAMVGAGIDRMTPGGTLTRFPIPGVPALVPAPAIPIKALLAASVQRGATQSIQVQTAPNAQITMVVAYPQSGGITATGIADAQGAWQYSWQVNATTPGSATVKLTIQSGGTTRHFTKHFLVL